MASSAASVMSLVESTWWLLDWLLAASRDVSGEIRLADVTTG